MKRFYCSLLFSLIAIVSQAQAKRTIPVYFQFDRFDLGARAMATLDSVKELVSAFEDYKISIKGYTDDAGSVEYNNGLALKRATVVLDYLTSQGVDPARFTFSGRGDEQFVEGVSRHDKRKTSVEISINEQTSYAFYGKYGTEVITQTNSPVSVTEYFSTPAMLKNNMFAIAEDGSIIETGGMISICRQSNDVDSTGKYYIVKIPNRGLRGDTTMRVWLLKQNSSGPARWKLSSVQLSNDSLNNVFIFRIPVGTENCISINLDRIIGRIYKTAVVYVSFYKAFKFTDLSIEDYSNALRFSAKLNDSSYAFVKYQDQNTRNMRFLGTEGVEGKSNFVNWALSNCIFSIDSLGNEYYHFCDSCFETPVQATQSLPQIPADTPGVKQAKKNRRGFFQWIADLFRKKKRV